MPAQSSDHLRSLARKLEERPLPDRVTRELSRQMSLCLEPLDEAETFVLDWTQRGAPEDEQEHMAVQELYRRAHSGPLDAASARARLVVGTRPSPPIPLDGPLLDFLQFLAEMVGIDSDNYANIVRRALAKQGFGDLVADFPPPP